MVAGPDLDPLGDLFENLVLRRVFDQTNDGVEVRVQRDEFGRFGGEGGELIEKGETLTADSVRRTVGMLEQGTSERPADVLTLNILSRRGRTIRPARGGAGTGAGAPGRRA